MELKIPKLKIIYDGFRKRVDFISYFTFTFHLHFISRSTIEGLVVKRNEMKWNETKWNEMKWNETKALKIK